MAAVVIVLFRRISTEFIRIVERKPGPISIGKIRSKQSQGQRSHIN